MKKLIIGACLLGVIILSGCTKNKEYEIGNFTIDEEDIIGVVQRNVTELNSVFELRLTFRDYETDEEWEKSYYFYCNSKGMCGNGDTDKGYLLLGMEDIDTVSLNLRQLTAPEIPKDVCIAIDDECVAYCTTEPNDCIDEINYALELLGDEGGTITTKILGIMKPNVIKS